MSKYADIARAVRLAPKAKRWDVWCRLGKSASGPDLTEILHEIALIHGFYETHGSDCVQAKLVEAVTAPKRPATGHNAAPGSTVEALVYDLRTRGKAALDDPSNHARMQSLNPQQSDEILYRLRDLNLDRDVLRNFAKAAP